MLFEEMLKDEREEGRREGEESTLQKMNQLTRILAEQNRIDDIVKAANDTDFQNQLFKEFNL